MADMNDIPQDLVIERCEALTRVFIDGLTRITKVAIFQHNKAVTEIILDINKNIKEEERYFKDTLKERTGKDWDDYCK